MLTSYSQTVLRHIQNLQVPHALSHGRCLPSDGMELVKFNCSNGKKVARDGLLLEDCRALQKSGGMRLSITAEN